MSVNPTRPTVDPLDAARQQMNFEAIAEQAPASKDILFKAQTIIPISAPRPWDRLAKGTGILGVSALLLFAPIIPRSASVALVNVQFEQQQFSREDAQLLVYDVLRDLPGDVLLGAGFNRAPGQSQDDTTGKLQLNLVKFNTSKKQLTSLAQSAIENKPKAGQPFYNAVVVARHRIRQSIPQAVIAVFDSPEDTPESERTVPPRIHTR